MNATETNACRDCGKRKARPNLRGLCAKCYQIGYVRTVLFPPHGESRARHARGDCFVPRPRPATARPLPEPTGAVPGSEEKAAVLAARAADGLELFHPLDPQEGRRRGVRVPSVRVPGVLRTLSV